jgi:environmental stress-induced protein Ves
MRPIVVPPALRRRAHWRNGRGESFQVWPRGSAARHAGFQLNVTPITAAGPFSHYPGTDRILAVIYGRLAFEARQGSLGPGDAVAFPGEEPMHALLPAGAATVFNVLMNRRSWRGSYMQHRAAVELAPRPGELVVAHAAQGNWSAAGVGMDEGTTMLLRPGDAAGLSPSGNGCLLLTFALSRR